MRFPFALIFSLSLAFIPALAWGHPDDNVRLSACRGNMACFPSASIMRLQEKASEHKMNFQGGAPEYHLAATAILDRINKLGGGNKVQNILVEWRLNRPESKTPCSSYTP